VQRGGARAYKEHAVGKEVRAAAGVRRVRRAQPEAAGCGQRPPAELPRARPVVPRAPRPAVAVSELGRPAAAGESQLLTFAAAVRDARCGPGDEAAPRRAALSARGGARRRTRGLPARRLPRP
jgi:hypothetical protein